jgi:hypothetical protein
MEIHRADLAYRRRSLWLLAALLAACAIGLWLLHGWLQAVQAHALASAPQQARRWLGGAIAAMLIVAALPSALWGRSLRRLGRAAREEGRFPPRAWKTYRDVRVLREQAALRWSRRSERLGRFAQLAAGMFAVAAVATWVWLS